MQLFLFLMQPIWNKLFFLDLMLLTVILRFFCLIVLRKKMNVLQRASIDKIYLNGQNLLTENSLDSALIILQQMGKFLILPNFHLPAFLQGTKSVCVIFFIQLNFQIRLFLLSFRFNNINFIG